MKKIGITGSISSGKTTASKILSAGRGPLFSADEVVKNLYQKDSFKNLIRKKFSIKEKLNIKTIIKNKILADKANINKLEKLIHPLVRKEMKSFSKKHKKKPLIFYEIPLLIEGNLMKYFDVIFFIQAKKKIRFRRFISKGGKRDFFEILNKKQLMDKKKVKYCDHIIKNEKNIKILKKKLLDILNTHE